VQTIVIVRETLRC